MPKSDIIEIEKGVYTLREKLSSPIVKIDIGKSSGKSK